MGKITMLTNIFQRGWFNHQPVKEIQSENLEKLVVALQTFVSLAWSWRIWRCGRGHGFFLRYIGGWTPTHLIWDFIGIIYHYLDVPLDGNERIHGEVGSMGYKPIYKGTYIGVTLLTDPNLSLTSCDIQAELPMEMLLKRLFWVGNVWMFKRVCSFWLRWKMCDVCPIVFTGKWLDFRVLWLWSLNSVVVESSIQVPFLLRQLDNGCFPGRTHLMGNWTYFGSTSRTPVTTGGKMRVYFRTKNVIQVTGISDPRCIDSEIATTFTIKIKQL